MTQDWNTIGPELLAVTQAWLAATDALNTASAKASLDQALVAHKAARHRVRLLIDQIYGKAPPASPGTDDYGLAHAETALLHSKKQARTTRALRQYVVRSACGLRGTIGYAKEQEDGTLSLQMEGEYQPFLLVPEDQAVKESASQLNEEEVVP